MAGDLQLSFQLKLSSLGEVEPSTDDLRSLRERLREDEHVGAHLIARPAPSTPATTPGQMGSPVEVLEVVADLGLQVAALVFAILAWRDSRPPRTRQEIRLRRKGTEIVITGNRPVGEIIAEVEGLLAEGDEDE